MNLTHLTRASRWALALLSLAAMGAQAQTIAAWNFENLPVAGNNSPAASTGTGTATALGMGVYGTPNVGVNTDDVVLGVSKDTGLNGVADTSNVWRVRAQGTTSNPANGWSSLAPIGTQGAEFASSTVGYTGPIKVSFDWYATTQGEANLQLAYTTDGSHWQNAVLSLSGADTGLVALTNTTSANTVLGSYVSDNLLNNAKAGQDWFTGLTATINDPLAANNASFAVKMVNASTGADDISTQGTALNNNSGNWRFDNVSISGIAAVPEPSSYMLALVAIAAVGLAGRGRKHQG